MNPVIVSIALLLGAVIGFIVATDFHGLAWKRLIWMQRQTQACQKEAIKNQREYLTKLAEIIEERTALKSQWQEATAHLQAAVETREQAKAQLEAALALRQRQENAP